MNDGLQIVRIYEGQTLWGVEVVRILQTEEVMVGGWIVLRVYDALVRETRIGAAENVSRVARQRVAG